MHLWISKNRILDIQKSDGIKDIHNSINGYHKIHFWISNIQHDFWISNNVFKDILK